jgi:hypothetical protein
MADEHRLIFVGGLHRSGTTPLARALSEHPQIAGLVGSGAREDEGQHLQPVYPKAKVYGGSGRFARDPRAHLTETSPLVTPANAAAMRAAWDPYWDQSRPFLLEKSPPNMIMGRFLQGLFPTSSMIVVVRHPVVVALSNKKWRKMISRNPGKYTTLTSLVEHWLIAHRIFMQDAPQIERLHVLRYEDLVSEPVRELARIQGFLGLAEPIPAGSLHQSASRTYEDWWDDLRSPLRPGGWQRRAIARKFGAEIAGFGYDVDDLPALGPWPSTPVRTDS